VSPVVDRRERAWAIALLTLAVIVALPLQARTAAAQAVVKGRVRALQSLAPLVGAEVLLENLGRLATTNDSGLFRLADIPLGVHQFRVRRIGFLGAVASLRIEAPDSVVLDLTLEAWVQELEPLFVNARPRRSAQMEEFEERRRIGWGRYLVPDDLRDNEHRTLADLVRERGIEVLHEPFGNRAVAIGSASPTFQNPSTRCQMRLLLNGVELPGEGNNLNLYPVDMLGAVEIYRRAGEAPIQYLSGGSHCGLILLWSRDR
jgi:hypothetical protein